MKAWCWLACHGDLIPEIMIVLSKAYRYAWERGGGLLPGSVLSHPFLGKIEGLCLVTLWQVGNIHRVHRDKRVPITDAEVRRELARIGLG
jgi:hypothetical protein